MAESPPTQCFTVTTRDAIVEATDLYYAGRHDECRSLCQQLLKQKPKLTHALHLLGVLEIERCDFAAALPYLEQALSMQDDNAEFHSNYGTLLSKLERIPEAIDHLQRAIKLKPDYAEAHGNLGSILMDQDLFAEALAEFQHAIALNPKITGPHVGAGCAHKQLLQFPESIAAFRRAIVLNEDNVEAHCNLALVLMQTGAFREGWREYEWRIRSKKWGSRTFRQPRWNGDNLCKRKILIPCEQGLGDTIQFIRYLPELKARGAKVVFECPLALKTLLNGFPGVDLQIDWPRSSDVESGVDCYVPLMSLPFHFGTTMATIPAPMSYLSANADLAAIWERRLTGPGLKIGLVWSGNPLNLKDHLRSCTLTLFAPLAEVGGATFFSLQKGLAADQARQPPAGMNLRDLQEFLTDFSETAAAIANLDLVISVDTSVAHLAGAMGKPVWTLLPYSPDWRWFLVRDDSPWYPTMRLFRQQSSGDWHSVFRQVAEALRSWQIAKPPLQVFRSPVSLDEPTRLLQLGRHSDADRACRQVIEQQPHHADAHHLLGNILFHAGRPGEAIDCFRRAIALRPGEAVIHFNLGVILSRLGRVDEAVTSYRRALAVDPKAAEVHFNLANLCRDRGISQEAIHHYEKAISAKPNYLKARTNLGNLLRRIGRLEEAIAQFQEALKFQPQSGSIHHNSALVLYQQGENQAALEHARNAVALEPQSPKFQEVLGKILDVLGKTDEAREWRDRAAAIRAKAATSS